MAAASFDPGVFDEVDVFGVGLGSAYLHEAAAHLFDDEGSGVQPKSGNGVELAVVPGALEELQDEHAHAVAGGAHRGAERGGGLALAGAGVDEDEAFAGFRHRFQVSGFRFQISDFSASRHSSSGFLQLVNYRVKHLTDFMRQSLCFIQEL